MIFDLECNFINYFVLTVQTVIGLDKTEFNSILYVKKMILHEIQISFNSIPQIKQIRVNPYKSFSIANMLISINFCFSPYAMGSHNQLPHLHHHSPPSLQTHDSSSARYLWDPSAVAASNFHHPSAHG